MLLGEFQHTLDDKNRVSLPVKFRSAMPGKVVVAKGFDGCLFVYPGDSYAEFLRELTQRPDFDPASRRIRRFFLSGAVETEIDKAGRLSLPTVLREHAGLSKDVTIIGNGERIEIWDAKRWASYESEAAAHMEDDAKELTELGLL